MNVLKRQDKPCRVQGNAAGEHANYLNVGCSSQYGRDCHHRRGHFYVHQNQVWSNISRQLDSLLEVGSSSNKIHNIVKVQYVADGFKVTSVQEPETSFKDDVAATKRILALQDGPCILVAHSYGGAVITEAGTDPSVVGLVYIAAHMPDVGEKESEDGKRFPSDLTKSGAIKKTPDGFTYIDPEQFHEYFAADVPADQAAFMSRSQVLNFADNFSATITTAAWRTKPSWMLVPGADRTINPDLERWYATRANSHKVEVAGASHCVYISHPKEVAEVIESAARASK